MLAWYKTGDVSWIGAIPRESIIVFDTETTGTKADVDEIIQLSVLDGNGRVLFSSYIKPERATSWPEAEAVNGIAPETVANAPRFADVATQVNAVFSQAQLLVAYNIGFDAKFLRHAGIALPPCRQFDVMQEFAPIAGRWNEGFQDYAWVKLEECAAHYQCAFGAHDALEDARATLHCFWSMLQDSAPGGYLELVGKHRLQQPACQQTAYGQRYQPVPGPQDAYTPDGRKLVSKVAYVLLAFFLGGFGIHNFYAGKVALGVVYLLFCWTLIPSIAAFVQAIVAICKTSDPYGRIAI